MSSRRLIPTNVKTSLPTDVLFDVVDVLPSADSLNVLSLNSWFLNTFSPALLRKFINEGTVFYIDADPSSSENAARAIDQSMRSAQPFLVTHIEPSTGTVHIRYPTYDAYGYDRNDIHVEDDRIYADPSFRPARGSSRYDRSPAGTVNWFQECSRGRVKVLNGEVFRNRFMRDCKVCEGKRKKCAGCGKGGRFSRAQTACGCMIPCPLCVGYETAVREKEAYEARCASGNRGPSGQLPAREDYRLWSMCTKSILFIIRETSNTLRLEWKAWNDIPSQ